MAIKTQKIDGILKLYKRIKEISENNTTIIDELKQLDLKKIQIILIVPDYSFWVIFGNATFDYGKGQIQNPDISIKCKTPVFSAILKQKTYALTEFFKKKLELQGDIQYAVVYFDFLNYSLDFIKNKGGKPL